MTNLINICHVKWQSQTSVRIKNRMINYDSYKRILIIEKRSEHRI